MSLFALCPANAADHPDSCVAVARIVSIQGAIQIRRSGQIQWSDVRKLDTGLCEGDLLHAGPRSRAALLISPETLVRLDQSSTLKVSQTAQETIVEFTKGAERSEPVPTSPNACGAGYFITRFPRQFRVLTPFINASVEGTEFLVAMRCESAQVAVFEGRVLAQDILSSSSEAVSLKQGELLEVGAAQPAAAKLMVKPVDAVQWALYYPPLSTAAGEAVADHECDQTDTAQRSACVLQRGEQRLRTGRVEEAERDIETLLKLGSRDGDAYALLAIISVVKNDNTKALELANRATQLSPQSPRAWLALSYAEQASFQLDKALGAAQKAAALPPASSIALARVAELLMSLGRIREAENAANAAVRASADDSRAHTVLGFVYLAQINTKAAHEQFLEAIELDSSDPLPRLGLGLALIRTGDLRAGREQIEIAVVLDPSNALLRTYVGKAYYEENTQQRDALAATQFATAKQLDPKDPTPWFYDAILKQSQNRSVEALEDAQKSIELNDYRAIYRARPLLDQDLAVRGTELARIYSDLGFGEVALLEGSRSLANDPASASAHRFLADSYLGMPRFEVARLSQLLQSQLWQPLNLQPIQPELEVSNLFIPRGTSQFGSLLDAPSPMFIRNGVSVVGDVAVATNDTVATDLAVAALKGPLSLGVGGFHYETDGFRDNGDQTQDLANVFLQYSPTPEASVQAEARWRREDQGDLALRFDPTQFSPNLRRQRDIDTYRLGLRYDFSPRSQFIVSALYQNTDEQLHDARDVPPVPPVPFPGSLNTDIDSTQSAYLTEAQYVLRTGRADFIAGAGYFRSKDDTDGTAQVTFFLPFPPFELPLEPMPLVRHVTVTHTNGYLYSHLRWFDRLGMVLGLSADSVDAPQIGGTHWNPKIGLNWTVAPGLSLRAAAFWTTTRDLVNNQTIEPTQIVGFNQFFDDPVGTQSRTYGVGLDKMFSPRLFAGANAFSRQLTIPLIVQRTSQILEANADEKLGRAYLYWSPMSRLALRADYFYDERSRDRNLVEEGYDYTALRTQRALAGLTWLICDSWSIFLTGSYTDQKGTFLNSLSDQTSQGSDQFFLADAEVRWRIPGRHGFVSAGVKNAFDTKFNFHEPDPGTPLVYPERFIYFRVSVSL